MIYFIIWAILMCIGLGLGLERHGKAKTGKHNFTYDLIAVLITVGLLYGWGAFDHLFGVQP